jgi:hypothetical protein
VRDDDDEELQAALQESLNDIRQHEPASTTHNVNQHLTSEEIRQRRLTRFQN